MSQIFCEWWQLVFFKKKLNLISLSFVLYSVIWLRYLWWNYFLNNVSFVIDFWDYFVFNGDHRNISIYFLMTPVFQQQLLYYFTRRSSQFPVLNIFSFLFLQTVLLINSIFLCFDMTFESSANTRLLTCFRVSYCFLCFFGCCEWWLPCIKCVMSQTCRE